MSIFRKLSEKNINQGRGGDRRINDRLKSEHRRILLQQSPSLEIGKVLLNFHGEIMNLNPRIHRKGNILEGIILRRDPIPRQRLHSQNKAESPLPNGKSSCRSYPHSGGEENNPVDSRNLRISQRFSAVMHRKSPAV